MLILPIASISSLFSSAGTADVSWNSKQQYVFRRPNVQMTLDLCTWRGLACLPRLAISEKIHLSCKKAAVREMWCSAASTEDGEVIRLLSMVSGVRSRLDLVSGSSTQGNISPALQFMVQFRQLGSFVYVVLVKGPGLGITLWPIYFQLSGGLAGWEPSLVALTKVHQETSFEALLKVRPNPFPFLLIYNIGEGEIFTDCSSSIAFNYYAARV